MSDDALSWTVTHRSDAIDYKIFSARIHRAHHPASGRTGDFSIIDSPNWVNVIALTPDDEVIMVRQYRHGTERVTLEIPGGLVDPGEDFLSAGLRELAEETGYTTDDAVLMGMTEPNPAFMNNRCGLVVARNVTRTSAQALDPNEVIDVVSHPLADIPRLVANGQITHTLVITAFYLLEHRDARP